MKQIWQHVGLSYLPMLSKRRLEQMGRSSFANLQSWHTAQETWLPAVGSTIDGSWGSVDANLIDGRGETRVGVVEGPIYKMAC